MPAKVKKIEYAWKQGITPILVGERGCGKTSIPIEVAKRIYLKAFTFLSGKDFWAFGGFAESLGVEYFLRLGNFAFFVLPLRVQ